MFVQCGVSCAKHSNRYVGWLDVTEAGGATPRSFANFAFTGECGRSVRVRHDVNVQHTYVMTMAKMRFAGIL